MAVTSSDKTKREVVKTLTLVPHGSTYSLISYQLISEYFQWYIQTRRHRRHEDTDVVQTLTLLPLGKALRSTSIL